MKIGKQKNKKQKNFKKKMSLKDIWGKTDSRPAVYIDLILTFFFISELTKTDFLKHSGSF